MNIAVPRFFVNISFFFIIAAYFLVFFNDFLGFEGALGIVLLLSIFVKIKFYKNHATKFTKAEKMLIFSISFYIVMMVISTLINYTELNDVEKFFAKYNKVIYFLGFVYLLKYIDFGFQKFEFFIKTMAYLILFMLIVEVAIYGFGTHLGGELSNKGTGAWFFSSVLIATIFLSFYKIHTKQVISSVHYASLSVVLLLVIVLSSTRSIWLSLFIALLITIPLAIKTFDLKKIMTLKNTLIIFVLLIITFSFVSNKLEKRVGDALDNIQEMQAGEYYNSLGLRLVMYQIAIDGFKENPVTGIGEVNYKKQLNEVYEKKIGTKEEEMYKKISKFKQIHNQFLMDAWMKGIFGLISILMIFLLPFIYFYKYMDSPENKTIGLIGITFLLSSFVFFQFGAVLTYSHGIVFFILWLVLLTKTLSVDVVEKNKIQNSNISK